MNVSANMKYPHGGLSAPRRPAADTSTEPYSEPSDGDSPSIWRTLWHTFSLVLLILFAIAVFYVFFGDTGDRVSAAAKVNHRSRALDFAIAKDYQSALAEYRQLSASNPKDAGAYYEQACCEVHLGDRQSALEHLRKAIRIDPRFRNDARWDVDLAPLRSSVAYKNAVNAR